MEDCRLRCPECGYNVTSLTRPECPECGTYFGLIAQPPPSIWNRRGAFVVDAATGLGAGLATWEVFRQTTYWDTPWMMHGAVPLVLLLVVAYLTIRTRHALPVVLAVGVLLLRSYLW